MVKKMENAPLNKRQVKFCTEFIKSFQPELSAVSAGYGESNARAVSTRLLNNRKIQDFLKELMSTKSRGREEIVEEFEKIAFSDISDYLEFNEEGVFLKDSASLDEEMSACISEVSVTGKSVKVKLYDKLKALVEMSKLLNLYSGDKHEISGIIRLSSMSDCDRDRELLKLIEKVK